MQIQVGSNSAIVAGETVKESTNVIAKTEIKPADTTKQASESTIVSLSAKSLELNAMALESESAKDNSLLGQIETMGNGSGTLPPDPPRTK